MDQNPRRDGLNDEATRIREVVGRHPLPDFVTGFDVRLGDIDGDPAVWVVFKTVREADANEKELRRKIQERIILSDAVQADLLDPIDGRYPYFRFEPS